MGEPTGLSQHMGRQAGGWQGLQDWRGAGATQIESGLEVGAWRREDQSKHVANPILNLALASKTLNHKA